MKTDTRERSKTVAEVAKLQEPPEFLPVQLRKLVLQQHGIVATFLVASLLINVGCSSGRPGPDDSDRQTRAVLGVVAVFYGGYLQNRKGKAPKDNEDFHKYLESRAEDLKLYNVESPDQLFNSPRDERPLVIVSGKVVAPPDAPKSPWAAFEQKGIDGKRFGVRVRGGIHELSSDEIDQILSSSN